MFGQSTTGQFDSFHRTSIPLPIRYIDKMTDFLLCLVTSHMGRFGASPNSYPLPQFLALLFKFTFLQPSPNGVVACLDIWSVVVDHAVNALSKTGSIRSSEEPITKLMNDKQACFRNRFCDSVQRGVIGFGRRNRC